MLIGVAIAIGANTVIPIGLNLQKYAHRQAERHAEGTPLLVPSRSKPQNILKRAAFSPKTRFLIFPNFWAGMCVCVCVCVWRDAAFVSISWRHAREIHSQPNLVGWAGFHDIGRGERLRVAWLDPTPRDLLLLSLPFVPSPPRWCLGLWLPAPAACSVLACSVLACSELACSALDRAVRGPISGLVRARFSWPHPI